MKYSQLFIFVLFALTVSCVSRRLRKAPPPELPQVQVNARGNAVLFAATNNVIALPRGIHSVACDFQTPWVRQVDGNTTNWLPFTSLSIAWEAPTPDGPWHEILRSIIPTNLVSPGSTNHIVWSFPITNTHAIWFYKTSFTLPGVSVR